MDKHRLHLQADRIEMVLQTHHAPARVTGGRVTPRLIQFHLQVAPATRVNKVEALEEEIALALGAPSARVKRHSGRLQVEVTRSESRTVAFLPLAVQLWNDSQLRRALSCPGTALLGLDSDGIPLLVRLASPDVAHILVAGTTGSGKTEVVRTMLASLAFFQRPREIQMVLIDPKGSAFRPFAGIPHLLCPPIVSVDATLERLRWLEAEMERRQDSGSTRPRLIVVLDELADLLMNGGHELQVRLTRLVQRGRSAGISLIACTQKPTAAAIGGLIKANFPVRLVGRVTSAEEARVASGLAGTGAERLGGRGDFILIAAGETVRFQAAWLEQAKYDEFKAHLSLNSVRSEKSARDRGVWKLIKRR